MSAPKCPDNISTTPPADAAPSLESVTQLGRLNATGTNPAGISARQPGVTRVDQTSSKAAMSVELAALCAVFVGSDPTLASRLLGQLVGVLHPDVSKPIDPATINHAFGLIEGPRPCDTTEVLTATMLTAAQHASLDVLRHIASVVVIWNLADAAEGNPDNE